jgi:hypothetical protein
MLRLDQAQANWTTASEWSQGKILKAVKLLLGGMLRFCLLLSFESVGVLGSWEGVRYYWEWLSALAL